MIANISTWLEIPLYPGLATIRRHAGVTTMPTMPGSPLLPLFIAAAAALLLAGGRGISTAMTPLW